MDPMVFRAFVKTALALQVDASDQTPPGYHEARAAVHNRFPGLEKEASTGRHLWEIGHLGVLAAPAAAELGGKHVSEKKKQVAEVVGLGGLATPYVHDLAMKNRAYAGSRVGRGLGKLFGHGL